MVLEHLVDSVGGTPIVRTHRLFAAGEGSLLLKLEFCNPTGSVKDRAARAIVAQAEADGRLRPGGTIIEATSGNFGRSLAMIGAALGYRVILVVDPKTPDETLRFATAMGAEIVVVAEADASGSYQPPRRACAAELARTIPGAFNTDQYDNPANSRVHREVTALEILKDVPGIEVLIAAVSTGGHISGIGQGLREARPGVEVVAVDAGGSSLFGRTLKPYAMRGIGLSWQPENLDPTVIDCVQHVSDDEAFATCRVVARAEGIGIGESGGAVVFASLVYALAHPGRQVVGVIPDGAVNYLYGGAFDDSWLADKGVNPVASSVASLREAARKPTYEPIPLSNGSARLATA